MVELDVGEQKLFAKYWGDNDLVHNEGFWEDVYAYYSQQPRDAPLPIKYTPLTVRMVLGMLKCPPGECGACCTYEITPIWPYDIKRIVERTAYSVEDIEKLLQTKPGTDKRYLNNTPDGCVFLKDNICTIYEARPDACYMFPIGFKNAALEGQLIQQMLIRLRCPQALAVAREIITESMSMGNKLLLPDLSIIPRSGSA